MELQGKKVLVFGSGKSGIGASDLLAKVGAFPVIYDGNAETDKDAVVHKTDGTYPVTVYAGELPKEVQDSLDLVVLSPGVPTDLPLVKSFYEQGLPVWGEVELAYRVGDGEVLAITGTNGKTTTTALLGKIMQDARESVFVVGNIGTPYTSKALEMKQNSVTVAEISSFQLETIDEFAPKVSAILNITEDHLNRHHTMEEYIRRYVHLATGNYNDSTAKLYTDCGIFTCDERFGEDATAVFNMLSGYSEPKSWNKLIVAPIWMKDRFLSLIEREAENAKKGLPALIRAKMNSLCDPKIIAGLYYASSCGVQVELLVRGICCLKVGVPGISENIHVRSIVGEFLEHSRIFYFENGGNPEIYMGSADWMPRNLDRRVEIVFPVEDEKIKKELEHVLDLEFKDNVKAHILQPDGTYVKPDKRGKAQINSQMEFCMEATEKAALHKHEEKKSRVFIPAEPAEDIEE